MCVYVSGKRQNKALEKKTRDIIECKKEEDYHNECKANREKNININ